MKLNTLIKDFLNHLKKENRTEKTIENYKFYLSRFVDFFGEKNPNKITEDIIKKYKKWLGSLIDVHGEPLKKNTQNYHLIALRNFLKYLQSKKINTIPYKNIKLDSVGVKKPNILSKSDIEVLLDAPFIKKAMNQSDNILNHRNKAILELLFSTGLLVSEISKLKKSDIDLNKNKLILTNKNKLEKKLTLPEQSVYWLKQYLDLRKDSNHYLFVSGDKRTGKVATGGITPRTIQRIVNKCARLGGIKKSITPHSLRHSYTLSLIKNGVSATDIKKVLGIENDNSKRYL